MKPSALARVFGGVKQRQGIALALVGTKLERLVKEYVLFFVLNAVGMLIALSCLWFSHYALGATSVLADNISANGVGLVLGTLFRFFAYRKWVFLASTEAAHSSSAPARN